MSFIYMAVSIGVLQMITQKAIKAQPLNHHRSGKKGN